MIHSVILMGQSNMSGRGFMNEVEPIEHDRIKVLRCGKWNALNGAVSSEGPRCGTSLSESFALRYAEDHPEDWIGLVPCSYCGSSLAQWGVGEVLYEHAVAMTKLAQRTSTVVAILWHQGECECRDYLYHSYRERFLAFMDQFRKDTGLEDVPVIVGGLGEYLVNKTNTLRDYKLLYSINEQLRKMSEELDYVGYASSEGLGCNPDNVHFNAKSLREFGLRYYDAFKTVEKKDRVFEEKEDINRNKSGMEHL